MKLVVLLVATLFAFAQAKVDWSKVIHKDLYVNPRGRLLPRLAKITGGEEAVPNSIPEQAAIFIATSEGTFFCGGTLISENYVLTAAHCVDLEPITSIEVVLGAHQIRDESEPTQVRIAGMNYTQHEDWSSLLLVNDIAVIKLATPAPLGDNIKLATLPTRADVDNDFVDQMARASGWGKDSDSAEGISPVLRYVNQPVISNDDCNGVYGGVVRSTNVCMSGADGKSTCNGDSGGPLQDNATRKQIGITSFGLRLGCEIGAPGVFTRVTAFLDWIQANTDVIIG